NAGINMQAWDLRYEPAKTFPGMILWGATTNGPVALPGSYTVRLTVDGKTFMQPVTIRANPLLKDVTLADLREQFDLAIAIRDKVSEANNAVIKIRDYKKQTEERLKQSSDPALKIAADSLVKHLSEVEESIYQVRNQSGQDPLNFPIKVNNRLATLLATVSRGEGKPIGAARPIFNDLSTELKVETDRLAKVEREDLAKLNAELRRLGLKEVSSPPLTLAGRP
ncbi:MAG TPA: glycosyl hydrolase, partial [Gemmatimonadaceae bacterium]